MLHQALFANKVVTMNARGDPQLIAAWYYRSKNRKHILRGSLNRKEMIVVVRNSLELAANS
jgi:hypothetical protein